MGMEAHRLQAEAPSRWSPVDSQEGAAIYFSTALMDPSCIQSRGQILTALRWWLPVSWSSPSQHPLCRSTILLRRSRSGSAAQPMWMQFWIKRQEMSASQGSYYRTHAGPSKYGREKRGSSGKAELSLFFYLDADQFLEDVCIAVERVTCQKLELPLHGPLLSTELKCAPVLLDLAENYSISSKGSGKFTSSHSADMLYILRVLRSEIRVILDLQLVSQNPFKVTKDLFRAPYGLDLKFWWPSPPPPPCSHVITF